MGGFFDWLSVASMVVANLVIGALIIGSLWQLFTGRLLANPPAAAQEPTPS